jgi:hypothetical protein
MGRYAPVYGRKSRILLVHTALARFATGPIFAMDILDEIYFAMLWVVLQCAMGLARVLTVIGLRRDAYKITKWVIEECKKVP